MMVVGVEARVSEIYALPCEGSQCHSFPVDICLLIFEG